MRKAFNFYRSYHEQLKLLNGKQRLLLYDTICNVQFLEININDVYFKDKILNIVWAGIKHSVEASLNGYLSKQQALGNDDIEPLSKGGIEAPLPQEKGEEQVKEKGKEKLNLTPKQFYESELEKSGNDKSYSQFIKFLFGVNTLERELSGVLSITEQLTFKQFEKLKNKSDSSTIATKILQIENVKMYWYGKTSFYMTLNNWLMDRFTK